MVHDGQRKWKLERHIDSYEMFVRRMFMHSRNRNIPLPFTENMCEPGIAAFHRIMNESQHRSVEVIFGKSKHKVVLQLNLERNIDAITERPINHVQFEKLKRKQTEQIPIFLNTRAPSTHRHALRLLSLVRATNEPSSTIHFVVVKCKHSKTTKSNENQLKCVDRCNANCCATAS